MILLPFAVGICAFNSIVKRLKGDTLILVWIAIVLAVFTFAQSKIYYYLLPAYPAFALAIAVLLYQLSRKIKLLGQLNNKIRPHTLFKRIDLIELSRLFEEFLRERRARSK